MIHHPIVKVALPVPLPRLFDYLQPEDGSPTPAGARVRVPFGNRKLVGVVIAHARESDVPSDRLQAIESCPDQSEPLLGPRLLELLGWCWKYYKHAPGDVVMSALPPALRNAQGRLPPPPLQYRITAAGRERLAEPEGRARAQYRLLQQLSPGAETERSMMNEGGRWRPVMKRLIEQGWAVEEPAARPPFSLSPGPELTEEQQSAVDRITRDMNRFHCHLLDGVTGSGKTEVYMNLIERVLEKDRQALVLVPEIGLTPQLIRRFRNRLGLQPAVIHSGLSRGARLEAWDDARSARARLVIGTRSALFTPLRNPGLLVLDEEHDASYKQQDGFRYSARDVAVKRAADLEIPVVLGSATPSLESLKNAIDGRYAWHRIRQRATAASLPDWRVLDLRQQRTFHGLTQIALQSIESTLEAGDQVMVFLNRRGYAPVLMCHQCGWHGRCDRCDANLTWHKGARHLSCHHCGSRRHVPELCPECRADALMGAGEGTQQLEEALSKRFPDAPVLRFDRDQVRASGAMARQLDEVLTGDPCILVGTQMLAKGHHFPGVTLVVIVNIDQSMYSADYRALERMGQMLLQVSGRAGRMKKTGSVILQTLHPEHQALQLLLSEGYEAYAKWLLEERAQAGLPPCSFQALLRAEAHDRDLVRQFLNQAIDCFPGGEARVHGPVPALMERVGGRSRMYLVVDCAHRAAMHRQIDEWLEPVRKLPSARKVRWSVDVDPSEL